MLIFPIKKLPYVRLFSAQISFFISRNAKVALSEKEYFSSKIAALAFLHILLDGAVRQPYNIDIENDSDQQSEHAVW